MRKSNAFSLIEIIIVVAIIGFIAAITVPSYPKIKTQLEIKGLANNLVGDLRKAQSDATTSQFRYSLRFNQQSSPTSYSLIKIDDENNETNIWTKELNTALSVEIQVIGNEFVFKADSTPLHAGQIILQNSNQTKNINVNPIGSIKIL